MNLMTLLIAIGLATTTPFIAPKQPLERIDTSTYVFSTKEDISDYIEARAIYYGYSPKTALAIANAESNLVINAKNNTSTASGIFQFINGSFQYFCIDKYEMTNTMDDKNNPFIQIECATKLLSQGGEKHWESSKHIWHALNE